MVSNILRSVYFMLAKKYRLPKGFNYILKTGLLAETDFLVARFSKNQLNLSRFAFIISKRVAKRATVRNLIKRRLSNAVGVCLARIKPGYDVVIITRPGIVGKTLAEIQRALEDLLGRVDILV